MLLSFGLFHLRDFPGVFLVGAFHALRARIRERAVGPADSDEPTGAALQLAVTGPGRDSALEGAVAAAHEVREALD